MRDRLFIVTGGSRGIGRALLEVAARTGDHTASVSRSGSAAHSDLIADLADPTEWDRVLEWIAHLVGAREWNRIDLVHNAATLTPIGFAGEVDSRELGRQVALNFAAPIVLGSGFLHAVRDLATASVLVQITSGAARTAYPGWSAYGPAKAGVDHWVRTVGRELELRGAPTKVVAVAPGVVDTAMQHEIRSSPVAAFPEVERFRDLHDTGSLMAPDQVAERLYQLIRNEEFETGSVVDLRPRG